MGHSQSHHYQGIKLQTGQNIKSKWQNTLLSITLKLSVTTVLSDRVVLRFLFAPDIIQNRFNVAVLKAMNDNKGSNHWCSVLSLATLLHWRSLEVVVFSSTLRSKTVSEITRYNYQFKWRSKVFFPSWRSEMNQLVFALSVENVYLEHKQQILMVRVHL